jgi:hypothetical protein
VSSARATDTTAIAPDARLVDCSQLVLAAIRFLQTPLVLS